MPKVNKEYINNKKNSIIEAAISVCENKPLYEITMKDIIKESGVSQGGIYRYFSDIDDVLIAVINQLYVNINCKEEIEKIIQNNISPKETIEKLFDFLGNYIKENASKTGKIQFELTILLANHPDRRRKIMSGVIERENSEYMINQLFGAINEGILIGEFKSIVPVKDIFSFIITSIDGILRDVILFKCYEPLEAQEIEIDEIKLMNTLKKSVLLILNCN